MMIHALINCSSDGANIICLSAFVVNYAAWLSNHLLNVSQGSSTPLEVSMKEKLDHRDLFVCMLGLSCLCFGS